MARILVSASLFPKNSRSVHLGDQKDRRRAPCRHGAYPSATRLLTKVRALLAYTIYAITSVDLSQRDNLKVARRFNAGFA